MGEEQNRFFTSLVDRLTAADNHQSVKNVPIENFKMGNDFEQWLTLFVDILKAVYNLGPNDQARINTLSLKWVPAKLQAGCTRAAYDNLDDTTKASWNLLRDALSKAYKNQSEEIEFLNDEGAWKRGDMSLLDYRNGLILRLDKYQPSLRNVQTEWERCAVRRFRAGMNNPILSAHILMTCVGARHTLEDAYSIACNYENTVKTLNSAGAAVPSVAAMLPIPMASMDGPPQMSSLHQNPQDRRLEAIETNVKKSELDMSELKSALTEVKEGIKEMKTDFDSFKQYQPQRPLYQGRGQYSRPYFPMARMPLANSPTRPYSQYRPTGYRPQNVTPGLTNGPGYITTPQRSYTNNPYPYARNAPDPFGSRMGRQLVDVKDPTQGASATSMGAMGTQGGSSGAKSENSQADVSFPNPHVQWGTYDVGYGWVGSELNEATEMGYDMTPEGSQSYEQGF